jgi:hypothetical protein
MPTKPALQPKRANRKKARGSELAAIQSLMSQALVRPLTPGETMQRQWADGTPTAEVAKTFIKPNDRLTSFERLQIYNQQYWWRLLGCFGEDFRGVRAVLGQKKFDRLAVAYLEHHGSQSWSLRDLGQFLPQFLHEHPDLTAPHTDLVFDMARVEWARVVAFDGPARPVIEPERLAGIRPDRLRLGLQPYLTLLELRHPIDELIRKQRESQAETDRTSNAVAASRQERTRLIRSKPSSAPIHLAVHRVDCSVYYKRLEPEAFALLNALHDKASLADACNSAFSHSPNPPEENAAKLREWFSIWTQLGWLTKAS